MDHAFKILLFSLLCLCCALALATLVRQARAERLLARALGAPELELAGRLDPARSEAARRLGDLWLEQFPPRPALAAAAYGEAAAHRPLYGLHWIDLARAELALNRPAAARRAMTMAERADPANQEVQLELGNLWLELDNPAEAIAHHAEAIRLDGSQAERLIPFYLESGLKPRDVAAHLLAGNPEVLERFFLDSLKRAEPGDAAALWEETRASLNPPRAALWRAYFDYLIEKRQFEAARRLWERIARQFYGQGWDAEREAFWNGGLERPLTFAGGLEWQPGERLPEGCELTLEPAAGGAGARALRIQFSGTENVDFHHVRHGVLLEPGRTWVLRCRARAEGLTSDSGPYLELELAGTPPVAVRSEALSGSGARTLELRFSVPAGGGWGELTIRREASARPEGRIAGDAWFEGFTLEAGEGGRR